MEGAGPAAFAPHLDAPLLALLLRAALHPNRYVREAAHGALGTACGVLAGGATMAAAGPDIAQRIGYGLSDNWSQVRGRV